MSGTAVPLGLALSVEPGTMVTTCHGIPAGSQIVVKMGPESHSATLDVTDEILDLCRFMVAGLAGPPLAIAPDEPKAGDAVFVGRSQRRRKPRHHPIHSEESRRHARRQGARAFHTRGTRPERRRRARYVRPPRGHHDHAAQVRQGPQRRDCPPRGSRRCARATRRRNN